MGHDEGQRQLAKWEKENNVQIETSTTWDEFTYFAGGHGDIVSMSTQETPVLEAETGIKTVTFGKYNYQRVPFFKRKGDPYKTLADIPKGSKICVSGPTSNAAFWGVLAKEMHDLDYRVGGGDFELLVNDHFVNPTNLLRGDCEAAAIIPEAAVPQMRKGELEMMYDGKSPFQLYKEFAPNRRRPQARHRQQLRRHPGVVRRQPGARREVPRPLADRRRPCGGNRRPTSSASTRSTSRSSPRRTSNYMIDFMSGDADWFVDKVAMDQEWIDNETELWELMKHLQPRQRELPSGRRTEAPLRGHQPPVISLPGSAMPAPAPPIDEGHCVRRPWSHRR